MNSKKRHEANRLMRLISILSIMILASLFLIPASSAIGLLHKPFNVPLVFQPNKEFKFDFRVTGYTYDAVLSAEGELKDYVAFEKIKDDKGIKFIATILLPDSLNPGTHSLFIRASDVLPPDAPGVGGKTAIRKSIPILVLSNEKIIKGNLITPNLNEHEKKTFSVNVESLSLKKIDDVWADINIYNSKDEFLKSINTNHISLKSNEKNDITALFDSEDFQKGSYDVNATVHYDEKELKLKSTFRIGSLNIKINKIPETLEKNTINKFRITIESEWNDILKDVYATIILDDKEFKTPTLTLNPWQQTELDGYVDTSGMGKEEMNVTVIIHYDSHEFKKRGTIRIIEDSLNKEESHDQSGKDTTDKNGSDDSSGLDITRVAIVGGGILLVILLLLNIYWMTKLSRNKKNG